MREKQQDTEPSPVLLLVSVDLNGSGKITSDETISYDRIGNPTTYLGADLTWFGRQLTSYSKGDTSVSYRYNEDGLRTWKKVNGVEREYVYIGDQLHYEKRGSKNIFYFYDCNGYLTGLEYDGVTYYPATTLNGDVVAIYDHNGTCLVEYEYDAWGNCEIKYDKSDCDIAKVNPIRYRGYYYDRETGLYYLQSRYYDPSIGRFVNADAMEFLGADGSTLSYNLFAYCQNNPVNLSDPTGCLPNLAKIAIGAVALAGAIALTVATGGAATAVAVGVAKIVGSVAISTAVSAGVGYLENGKQGAIDGASNGFMFGSLSACGGAALKCVSSAINKTSVVTSVSETPKIAGKITGYTKHGLNQAIGRNGVGVKPSAILDAVRNPTNVVTKIDDFGRISTQYRGSQSTVVLNEAGKVISCWAKSSKYWRV